MDIKLSELIEQHDIITLMQPEVVWDAAQHCPQVIQRLSQNEPSLPGLLAQLREALPVQTHWGFGRHGVFERPDRHVRAWYLRLDQIDGSGSDGGCLAIKGAEAACDNFDAILDRLKNLWNLCTATVGSYARTVFLDGSLISALERFPVIEGKPPGVHPLWDALEEAECAHQLQSAYLQRFDRLARAPVPLLVYRWPDRINQTILERIEAVLPEKIARIVAAEIKEGLGTYLYYYPSLPLRVIHMQIDDAAGMDFKQRLQQLSGLTEVDQAIDGWIDLTARMLSLGYLPTDPANLSRGYCLHAQNLVLDGGFVDVNSIRKLNDFPNQGTLRFALTRTVQELAQGISYFLIGSDARMERLIQWTPEVYALVHTALGKKLRDLASDDHPLHPSLVKMFQPDYRAGDLSQYFAQILDLGSYHPGELEPDQYRLAD